jgi:interferon-induced transmembrane protein
LPFGIVSIVYAAQVDNKISAREHAGALEASRRVRMRAWVAFGSGLVVLAYVIVVIVIIVGAAGSDGA